MSKYIRYIENGLQRVSKLALVTNLSDGLRYTIDTGHSIDEQCILMDGNLEDVLQEGDLVIVNGLPYIIDIISIQKTICCQNTIINKNEIEKVLTNSQLNHYLYSIKTPKNENIEKLF